MKKYFIIILLFILVGCGKVEEEKEEKNNDNAFYTETVIDVKETSERRKNLDKLIKDELIKKGYIIEKDLKSFTIDKISVYGYYKKTPTKKDMQINYSYECNNGKYECVKNSYDGYDGYVIWVNTDEKKIYEIKSGLTLSYSDVESGNYVRVDEIIE
jgi:hypothetical protein